MKALIIIAILVAMGLIYLRYKRENDIKKMLFSSMILIFIIGLAILGNTMRILIPLFLAHIIALILAYGGLVYYIVRDKKQWILWLFPLLTLIVYVLLAWIGNEHIIWFSS
ncbi:MAG: hypothetical protein KU29_12440 [Sulfurovum sp. FS06-10]|nr:MAG: hypothetical protein KU29_12440 [Sulfurovum sp. FS06-10]